MNYKWWRDLFNWNPVYNLVMEIKDEYIKKYGEIKEYKPTIEKNVDNMNVFKSQLEIWIEKLGFEEYINFIEPLQINQHDEFILIRYGLAEMQKGMWTNPNSIYRECRSLTLDLKKEAIVLSPFRKFFNLNEVEENKIEKVKKEIKETLKYNRSLEFTNKMDGSMQCATWYNNNIFMSGSQAINPNKSWRLKGGYKSLTINHKNLIKENPNYTFIFEYISLNDAHIVKYKKEEEGLYLVGARDIFTGDQLSYEQIKIFSALYKVPMTAIEDRTFDEILKLAQTKSADEKEGWVINIDGHLIKLKCDDYVELHRVLDKLASVNTVIRAISHNTYDDLISKVPDVHQERINKIANIIFSYIIEMEKFICDYYNKAPKKTTKEFMTWINNNVPKRLQGYVRCMYKNQEYHVLYTNYGKTNKYIKMKEILRDIDNLELGVILPEINLFSDIDIDE
ncbi:MAG: RNA ligase [archaeon]